MHVCGEEAKEWGWVGLKRLRSIIAVLWLTQTESNLSCGSQLCLFCPQLSLLCFVDKELCSEILPEQVSLCLHMATCGTNICRWSWVCVCMQMVRGVSGRMGLCTKTAGLSSMAPL